MLLLKLQKNEDYLFVKSICTNVIIDDLTKINVVNQTKIIITKD